MVKLVSEKDTAQLETTDMLPVTSAIQASKLIMEAGAADEDEVETTGDEGVETPDDDGADVVNDGTEDAGAGKTELIFVLLYF